MPIVTPPKSLKFVGCVIDMAKKRPKIKKLNTRHKSFIREYLKDMNGTQAAIRAGYSAKTASSKANELLRDPMIAEQLVKVTEKRMERVEIDADYVLRRLVTIDQMDVADILNDDGTIKPVSQWPEIWRQMISGMDLAEMWQGSGDQRELIGILKKMKWPDKVKNLELIGKHINVQAFKDRVEHEGDITNLVPVVNVNLSGNG